MNLRGQVLSVYWFVILVLVATGIFMMVSNFYNYPYDVREIESDILLNNVADCIVTGGYVNEYALSPHFEDDFFEICSLNFTTDSEQGEYYVGLNILSDGKEITNFGKGNMNLISSCGNEGSVEKNNLAKCSNRSFYALDENNGTNLIKILTIVRKIEQNVK